MPEENRSRPRTFTVSANMDVEMDVDVDGLGSVQKECLEWLAAILRLCVGVQPPLLHYSGHALAARLRHVCPLLHTARWNGAERVSEMNPPLPWPARERVDLELQWQHIHSTLYTWSEISSTLGMCLGRLPNRVHDVSTFRAAPIANLDIARRLLGLACMVCLVCSCASGWCACGRRVNFRARPRDTLTCLCPCQCGSNIGIVCTLYRGGWRICVSDGRTASPAPASQPHRGFTPMRDAISGRQDAFYLIYSGAIAQVAALALHG